MAKVKNISRGDFGLSLESVTKDKHILLHPGDTKLLNEEEIEYLSVQCPGSFTKGFLQIVEIDKELEPLMVESSNIMSAEDIEKLVELTPVKFRKAISEIDGLSLLKDIRAKAVVEEKSKLIVEVDEQIAKHSGGSILL